MCGITGWVDFEADLSGQRTLTQAMTDTMACRGPDAEGMWLDRHVALGHRRLAIIDLEGGRQPMSVEDDGHAAAVLTYSGEVYNFHELRTELAGRGHRFQTSSDTEVVLHAYLEWGDSFVDHLNGMYAFAIWDTRKQELLLVRDRMGIKPLYYHALPHGVLFGSEPKAILANPQVKPVLNLDGLREMLSFVKTPERSAFADIHEVRPGSVVRVHRGGIDKRRYWKLEAHEHTDDLDTTIGTVRDLLEDIVQRQLISDVPLCTLLSGGLDSSAITALAAKALAAQESGPVRSFAVDFVGYAENFKPDPMRDTPDTPYVHELAEHVHAAHSDIVLSTSDLMDPHVRARVVRATDSAATWGDAYISLFLLFRAIREHSTVALSGESADEVFGGYRWFHDPRTVNADTFPWLAAFDARSRRGRGLFDPALTKRLDLRAYREDSYRQAIAEVPRLDGETGHERRMREISYLHLTRFVQLLLDRKDRMSMASGLEVRVPFCDHRLVEYVFNTPWAMKTFDGHEKSLLRAATRHLLPASIAERRKSPYPTTQDPSYEQALREEFARVVGRGDAPIMALLGNAESRGVLDGSPSDGNAGGLARPVMEFALSLNTWLQQHDVRIDLPV